MLRVAPPAAVGIRGRPNLVHLVFQSSDARQKQDEPGLDVPNFPEFQIDLLEKA